MYTLRKLPFALLLLLSGVLHAALIAYGTYHDRSSAIKYTDVDYHVFTDAARYLARPVHSGHATSWSMSGLGMQVGDPYERNTYRYTPLVALLLIPNVYLHPAFGKLIFSLANLLVSVQLRGLVPSSVSLNYLIFLWTLNPFPLNISTRGSSEALVGLCVISSLTLVKRGRLDAAAAMLGLATHLKIYPFVYGVAVLSWLARGNGWKGWLSQEAVRFTLISAGSFVALGCLMYSIWGQSFVHHTYLYHVTRLDHRHNFSPFFYLTYLTYSLDSSRTRALLGFVPQLTLTFSLGAKLGSRDLSGAWAAQTAAFVMLNKVCTSQYFMWYLWFLPIILPRVRLRRPEGACLFAGWVMSQVIWLSFAFRLEFKGANAFLPLWGAALAFVCMNAWILGRLIASYDWDLDGIVLERGTEKTFTMKL